MHRSRSQNNSYVLHRGRRPRARQNRFDHMPTISFRRCTGDTLARAVRRVGAGNRRCAARQPRQLRAVFAANRGEDGLFLRALRVFIAAMPDWRVGRRKVARRLSCVRSGLGALGLEASAVLSPSVPWRARQRGSPSRRPRGRPSSGRGEAERVAGVAAALCIVLAVLRGLPLARTFRVRCSAGVGSWICAFE